MSKIINVLLVALILLLASGIQSAALRKNEKQIYNCSVVGGNCCKTKITPFHCNNGLKCVNFRCQQ